MAQLILDIDDEILHRARIKALEQGTTVGQLLRDYLHAWVGDDADRLAAADRILEATKRHEAGSGGQRWTRDELHER